MKQKRAQTASAIGRATAAKRKIGNAKNDQTKIASLNTTMNGFNISKPEINGKNTQDSTVVL